MRNATIRAMTGRDHSRLLTAVLCGVAGFALALPAVAKDQPAGTPTDFYATVSAVREVPAGEAMPGMHIDAKIKGRVVDIYIAPMEFVKQYGIKISKGDEVRVIGTEVRAGEASYILANEVTTGSYDNKGAIFRADMTYYLRNEDGPFWKEISPATTFH
jgi:hypothetical protein